MRHTILNGDVIACLRSLPDACVQCVVTSPPYWGLRDYGVEGQIGLEPTPEGYVEKMVEVFREVWRVLRDDGTLWLNLGDSYNGSGGVGGDYAPGGLNAGQPKYPGRRISTLKPKDLVGIPWRVAFALQEDGWYLRSDIIWSKPNQMPESVTDRPTKSHEYIFLLTKQARYFYDADAIRERIGEPVCMAASFRDGGIYTNNRSFDNHGVKQKDTHGDGDPSYSGRNRRTVWEIATQPMPYAHFATFPEALVEPCIKAGTSERGACPKCGAPWRRMVETSPGGLPRKDTEAWNNGGPLTPHKGYRGSPIVTQIGWQPSCTCGCEETVPCVVLDPFGGSGTVAKVARDLGRSSVMIELNPAYVGIMKRRLRIGEQLDSGVCEYEVRSLLREV